MSIPSEYWSSLERLINNEPNIIPRNSKINKNNVALEAGKKAGSIKKSRTSFSKLIIAIEKASEERAVKKVDFEDRFNKERIKRVTYQELYHNTLNRELMLIERLSQLEKQLKRYDNVTPLKSR
jgi:hypothetical protein